MVAAKEGVAGGVLLGSRGLDLLHVSAGRPSIRLPCSREQQGLAHLEGNGVRVRVLQAEGLRHLVLKGSWPAC